MHLTIWMLLINSHVSNLSDKSNKNKHKKIHHLVVSITQHNLRPHQLIITSDLYFTSTHSCTNLEPWQLPARLSISEFLSQLGRVPTPIPSSSPSPFSTFHSLLFPSPVAKSMGTGEHCKLPHRSRGRAPATIAFLSIISSEITAGDNDFPLL